MNKKETYIVSGSAWIEEVEIEPEDLDTKSIILEVATRAIEKAVRDEGGNLGALVEVYNKKDEKDIEKHFWLSSYIALNNASMFEEAEQIRKILLKETGVDVKRDLS